MSMFSFRNCTEPSHNRNRPPFGWSLRKFGILPTSGFVSASAGGLGLPLLALPCPVRSREIGGPNPAICVLLHVLKALVTNPGPTPPGGRPKSANVSVTGFLFNCSMVVPPPPPVSTNWAASELLVLFTNWSLIRTWIHTGWGAFATLAGTPIAVNAGGIAGGHLDGVRQ